MQLSETRARSLLGFGYLLGMLVCGLVVIAMEVGLRELAINCNVEVSQASYALVYRSTGSVFGVLFAGKTLDVLGPHVVLYSQVLLAAFLFEATALTTSINVAYAIYFVMGMVACTIQTSVLLLTRCVFPKNCGPWLQGGSFAFQAGVCLFPFLDEFLDFYWIFQVLFVLLTGISAYGTVTALTCLPMIQYELPDQKAEQKDLKDREEQEAPGSSWLSSSSYICLGDLLGGTCLFFTCGLVVQITSYLEYFVAATTSEAEYPEALGAQALVGLTFANLVGQLACLPLQRGASDAGVTRLFLALGLACGLVQLLPMVCEQGGKLSSGAIWTYSVGTGLFFGPLNGLIYDLWDRYTSVPTAWGSATMNFGIYAGSGFATNIMYYLWEARGDPFVLPWFNFVEMAGCLVTAYALTATAPADKLRREKTASVEEEEEGEPLLWDKGEGGKAKKEPQQEAFSGSLKQREISAANRSP